MTAARRAAVAGLALLLAGCGPSPGPTATRLASWHGATPGDQLGTSLALLGDLDGDGVPEAASGASRLAPGATGAGYITIVDGLGKTLRTLSASTGPDGFGLALARYGDADGDGQPELLVGAPMADEGGQDTGLMALVSGADGTILISVPGLAGGDAFGVAVAVPGDLDADGILDLAGGALQPALGPDRDAGPGALRVHSGSDGRLLFARGGLTGQDDYGSSLATPGDLNGDGIPDLVVGAPGAQSIDYISGANGQTLLTQSSILGGFGTTVVAAGDIDRDGIVDVAVGAPQGSLRVPLGGAVVILSGRDGTELGQIHGERTGERLGAALASLADLDDDGLPELAVGSAAGPRVIVVSLPSGTALLELQAGVGEDRFGQRLAADGRWLLVGFPGQGRDGSLPGGAALYRLERR